MPIEMPKGLPFSVDTWTSSSSNHHHQKRRRRNHYFLTHAHKDHLQGFTTLLTTTTTTNQSSCFSIYATRLTKSLTLGYYPHVNESLFVEIEVGETIVVDDDPAAGLFKVTAFDANHCPGAVMFLFEGTFGNILHTGDCRLTPECLQKLPEKYIGTASKEPKCRLDYVFLDCTFGAFSSKLPSKHVAVRQVIDCIWKHPDARPVYLTCDLLGQEEILVSVSETFGSKIYVDKENSPECFQSLSLTVPSILSQDPTSRFHIFDGFPRLTERAERKLAEARANFHPEPLIIRPSTQWYVFEDVSSDSEKQKKSRFKEAMRDKSGIWHVCYSMHSSRDELEWALRLLAPRWVVSTTPEFRAMDLSYVRRHCSFGNLAKDDPLWKLLDIDLGDPLVIEDLQEEISISRSQLDSSQAFVNKEEILTVPSEVKESTVTLFGRARVGLHNSTFTYEDLVKPEITFQNGSVEDQEKHEVGIDRAVSEGQHDDSKSMSKELIGEVVKCTTACSPTRSVEVVKRTAACSPTRLSNGVGENIRKFYRSMHIPVPKPLPSLVALLNDRKRAKTRA